MCLGIPAKIIQIDTPEDETLSCLRTGLVAFGRLRKKVNLACVPEAKIGDHVLIHAGIAIGKLLPEEVEPILDALESLREPG